MFKKVEKPVRFAEMSAADKHRLTQVSAMAIGELRRMAGMTPGLDGTVDVIKLDAALAGQPVDRRLRLKSMLAECGMIPR